MAEAGRVVAIIGASNDRRKYGNRAVRAFARQGYVVHPVHPTATTIEGIPAYTSIAEVPGPIHVVSMYVPPDVGERLLEGIAARHPSELWVNPGAESPALLERARALGLQPILACSVTGLLE